MIYYKHYIGDYQRHTGHLTLAQDGAYRRLMDHYYSTEQALPASLDTLYRICGAMEKKEREAVAFVVKAFFTELAGHLHHERIDEEVSLAQEKIANLKENAKAGGKESGKKRASKIEANASSKNAADDEIDQKNDQKTEKKNSPHENKNNQKQVDRDLTKNSESLYENNENISIKNEANGEANASPNGQAGGQAKTNISHKSVVSKHKEQLQKHIALAALPPWLSESTWTDWVTYRKFIKAPMTLKAAELCIAKLESLRSSGNDPQEVIEQSIMSGKWTGLFPIKPDFKSMISPMKPDKFDPTAYVNRNAPRST